jgi:succinoglycan biosynthesis protein ExoA
MRSCQLGQDLIYAQPVIPDPCPLVSILMPVRNEALSIKRSLESLLTQTYPLERIEILIIDGMSDDGTRQIVQKLTSDLAIAGRGSADSDWSAFNGHLSTPRSAILILDNPSRTVPMALNIGLQRARGETIIRLDGHSEMMPNYVETCLAKLQERPDLMCVGGPSVAVGRGSIGRAYALALRSGFGAGGSTFRTLRSEAYVDTLAFGAYRKSVFVQLGGFDPELERNQDIEFNARLRKAGYRLLLIQSTRTLYHAPESLTAIVRQSYNNGYWNTKVLGKMIGVLSWRHFAPGVLAASLLLSLLATPLVPKVSYGFLILWVAYILACLYASAGIGLRSSQPLALLLPLVFSAMHISYGVGSVIGLFHCAVRAGRKHTVASPS